MDELAKFLDRVPFRRPTEEYRPSRLVYKDLEDAVGRTGGGRETLQMAVKLGGVLMNPRRGQGEEKSCYSVRFGNDHYTGTKKHVK